MEIINLSEIEDPREKQILEYLDEKGECVYGNIFKELAISSREGQHIILSMLSKGLIRYQDRSSNLELNVRIR